MAKINWTEAQLLDWLKKILLQYGEDLGANNYARLDIAGKPSVSTMTRWFGSWSEAKTKALPGSADVAKNALIKTNQQLVDRLERERNKTQIIIDACMAAAAKMNIRPVPIPKKTVVKENLEFHQMRSDAQVGEFIDPELVQGLSSYSSNLYPIRHDRLIDKMLTFKEQDKRSLGLNKLVIHHLGDQVEGESIFPGQPFEIDSSLIDQLFHSVEVETNGILRLAKEFNEIEICCVAGNHGRPGMKGQHHKKTNFDTIFYRILQITLKNQKNVKVLVSKGPSMVVNHGRFTFLLNHGDNATGWAGIPYYGLDRQFNKLANLFNMNIDYELVGHHHTATNLCDKILINGCLPGGSNLSINKMGLSSRPSQKAFYFHPDHGLNRESNLYLEDQVKLEPDHNRVYTAYHE